MAEWETIDAEYPNPAANCRQTSIRVHPDLRGAMYYHVEGGFVIDRYRSNAKLYTTESEVRGVLLRKMLVTARKCEREILSAIESVD